MFDELIDMPIYMKHNFCKLIKYYLRGSDNLHGIIFIKFWGVKAVLTVMNFNNAAIVSEISFKFGIEKYLTEILLFRIGEENYLERLF